MDFTAIFKAIASAFTWLWKEREIKNRPDMVKNVKDRRDAEDRDKRNRAYEVLSDPTASQKERAKALEIVRKSHS